MHAMQDTPETDPVRVARLSILILRAPVERPVRTASGAMTSRPCLLVRVEDADGARGWGEIWCNFPGCGAEHRARLLETLVAPRLLGHFWSGPAEAFRTLGRELHAVALQAGEPGPIAQVLAGLDIALWDLLTRRLGVPLHRRLGSERERVPAYASGIDPAEAVPTIERARAAGHRRFKIKVGFGREVDLRAVAAAAATLAGEERLMVDANQRWDLPEARRMAQELAAARPLWIEEPLPADAPWRHWRRLAAVGVAIAAGENLLGEAAFDAALAARVLGFVQPDACKWGGITGCLSLARPIADAGAVYCPHFLGGGVGLLASAHLLAAAGGDGMLEMDVNPNPLRSELLGPILPVVDATASLPEGPGLGAEPDPAVLARFTTGRGRAARGGLSARAADRAPAAR